jgi:hypothetical protein
MNRIEMDELLAALDRAGESTNAVRAWDYLAAIDPTKLDTANKDRAEALYEAVAAARDPGVPDLTNWAYSSLEEFERDYEQMGEV